MKILPITNTDYRQKMNFGSVSKAASRFVPSNLSNLEQTVKTLGGAVIVLAAINTKQNAQNTEDDFQIKDLTDEEFEAKKAEILAKKDEFEPFGYIWNEDMFTKWNVQLFDYMYQDCKGLVSDYPTHKDFEKENNLELYKEYMYLQCDPQYCVPVESKEQAKVVLKMMKMPWLFASDGVGGYAYALNNAGYNIKGKKSAEIGNVKLEMLNEFVKNREKYDEDIISNGISTICEMIADVTTNKGLNVALKMIRHPELFEANECTLKVGKFFNKVSENKDQEKIASDIIDKIVQNPELFEKEEFDKALTNMLRYSNNEYRKMLVLKFLDNPALFDYEDFVYALPGIISDFPSSESDEDAKTRENVFKTLEYYKKNPELLKKAEPYKHPDFVYALTYYCEIPDMDCPEWPIKDSVIEAIKHNPELFEEDDW